MTERLLEIVACPCCYGKLQYDQQYQELVCTKDQLAFPVREGIPVLLEDQARNLNSDN